MTHPNDLYFAYGSNLSTKEHQSWELPLDPVGPAELPDHRLAFTRYSENRKSGALDVVPTVGSVVPGFLFRVRGEGWSALDDKEGAPRAYERVLVTVLRDDGTAQRATTYRVVSPRPDHVPPNDDYRAVVTAGRREHKLPTDDLEAIFDGDRRANQLRSLFVYGSLLRGEPRAAAVAEHRPSSCILADLPGVRLVDCGDYPGLVLGEREVVRGEFVRFPAARAEAALTTLDGIEGFHGHGRPGSLFERRLVWAGVGDGRMRRAWTYVLVDATGTRPLPGGDWRRARGAGAAFYERLAAAHCADRPEAEVARAVARAVAFAPDHDGDAWLPLAKALADGEVSERRLAQVSRRWTALVGQGRRAGA